MTPTFVPTRRASRVRFIVLTFICTLSVLTYLDRICISRVRKEIQADLLLSDVQMGFVLSSFIVGYLLFEVPGGWMGDRWGSRRVLTRIVLWWSLFTALTGSVFYFNWDLFARMGWAPFVVSLGDRHVAIPVLSSFVALLLVRFLFGCGEAGAYPNVTRVVGNWFPYRERGVVLGAVFTTARLGGAIAPLVIGTLTRVLDGWRRAFGALGALGIVWCVLFAWWFRDRPEDQPACNNAERDVIRAGPYSFTAQEAGHAQGPVPWGPLLLSPNLWALCLASFCVGFAWWFFPTWYPKFLEEVHHFSYEEDPLLKEFIEGLPFLCGAAGCLVGGRLSDRLVFVVGRRWGRSLLGLFGFGGAALCFLVGGLVSHAALAVTLLSLACFLNDMAVPVLWALAADIGGRYAGTVGGFANMVGGFGAMITPVLIPHLYGSLSGPIPERWVIVMAVLAAVWLVGALAWLGIDASRPLFPTAAGQGDGPHVSE
jgi:MFS family permease